MSTLIFDLDGVIITYEKNFAETYAIEFGIAAEEIYDFFSKDYYDCAIGRADLSEKIEKYVSAWKWPHSTNSLIQYWFDCQSKIDSKLVEIILKSKSQGHKIYIASDQDKIRTKHIENLIDFRSIFDGNFFSCEVGAMKCEPYFFEHLVNSLNCTPNDAFFWDDNPKNVEVARNLGINAETYTGIDNFRREFVQKFTQ